VSRKLATFLCFGAAALLMLAAAFGGAHRLNLFDLGLAAFFAGFAVKEMP